MESPGNVLQSPSEDGLPSPSKVRFLVAWYLDLLLAGAVVSVAMALLGIGRSNTMAILSLWALLEVAIWRFRLGSFGYYAMGMSRDARGRWFLDPLLKAASHWLILLLAGFQFYEGCRIFAEGIVKYDWYYLLGRRIEASGAHNLLGLIGIGMILGSVGLFRCKRWGPWLAALVLLLVVGNDLASAPLLREMAASAMLSDDVRRASRAALVGAETLATVEIARNLATALLMLVLGLVWRRRFQFRGLF